jgi:hypothetical protein
MNNNQKILALASVGAVASYFILKKSKKVGFSSCPSGMQSYFGTCIPIKNEYAACPQGYMKETIGGPCVLIPESTSIGGCGAGEDYRMGYRLGDLTPTMGCYPIGANIDINLGSSTGQILGGGAGSNIGGGGTVQGGSGNYADTSESHYGGGKTQTNVTCNSNQQYDTILGMCVNKEVPPALIVEPFEEETTITTFCPDNYFLANDNLCYPKPSIPTPTSTPTSKKTNQNPKSSLSGNSNILLIAGGLLLAVLLLRKSN